MSDSHDGDDRLGRIEDKVDKIGDKLSAIDVTLVKQHVTLVEHIKRSEANEKAIEILQDKLLPIRSQYDIIKFVAKVIALLIGSGFVTFIIKAVVSQ